MILMRLNKELLLKAFGKKKKGRLMPVKVMTKRGFEMTVYKAPEELKTTKKLQKTQQELVNKFLPLAHKIANIYMRKVVGINYDDIHSAAVEGLIVGVSKLTKEKLQKEVLTKKHLSAYINKYVQESMDLELQSIGVVRKFDYNENTYVTLGYIDSLEKKLFSEEDPDSKALIDIIADDMIDPVANIDNEIKSEDLINEQKIYLDKLKRILQPNEYNALYLNMIEGLSFQEIGKRLHMSNVGAFKAFKRAKEKIKKYINYLKYLKKIKFNPEEIYIPGDIQEIVNRLKISSEVAKIAYKLSETDKTKFETVAEKIKNYKIESDEVDNNKINYYYDPNNNLKLIQVNVENEKFLWVVDKL